MARNLTMLIFSCDKFSDLWTAHVKQLEKHWKDRLIKTYIVTDKPTSQKYENVEVLSAGDSAEFTDRVKYALEKVDTDYVFVTLDDYFLIKDVDDEKIEELLYIMEEIKLDYLRLYRYTKRADDGYIAEYPYLIKINPSIVYGVNLYAGIWKKEFLASTLKGKKNPWQYEVSLASVAEEYGAKCALSTRKEFEILDVVRKGKILYSANKYIKKHNIEYTGNRPVHSYWYELRDYIRGRIIRIMPKRFFYFIRNVLIKLGFHFYSQDVS